VLPGLTRRGFLAGAAGLCAAHAAPGKISDFPLPDALTGSDGKHIRSTHEWEKRRRPELMRLFAEQVYGQTPKRRAEVEYRVTSEDRHALNNLAVRRQIVAQFGGGVGPAVHILLYLPAETQRRAPVFVGLNFGGNHTVASDPGIELAEVWTRDESAPRIAGGTSVPYVQHTAAEASRGSGASRWQVEKILAAGFGLATAYYGDIEPDFDGGMSHGVRPLLFATGQTAPDSDQWGAIGAWAWGLSRIVDYLETDRGVDARRIALIGHSRLGKTALWAAAQDERFALVISNESGKGGASLYRRLEGETIEHLNTAFPHWFCGNFHRYTGHPDQVPVDGNLLLAMTAPRPLYVASAEEDHTSDPPGEFYSAMVAGSVWELFGRQGLGTTTMPPVNTPVGSADLHYHVRTGKHNVTAYDWEQYLKFASARFHVAGA
jgi:hypothetical protein